MVSRIAALTTIVSQAAALGLQHTITKTVTLSADQCLATLQTQTSTSFSTAYPVVNVGGIVQTVSAIISQSADANTVASSSIASDTTSSSASHAMTVKGEAASSTPQTTSTSTGLFSYPGNGNILPETTSTTVRTLTTSLPDVWVTVTADTPYSSDFITVTSWTLVNGSSSAIVTAVPSSIDGLFANASSTIDSIDSASLASATASTGINTTVVDSQNSSSSLLSGTAQFGNGTAASASPSVEISTTSSISSESSPSSSYTPVEITMTSTSSATPTETSITSSSSDIDSTTTTTITMFTTLTTTIFDEALSTPEAVTVVTEEVHTEAINNGVTSTVSGTDNTDTVVIVSTITSQIDTASATPTA